MKNIGALRAAGFTIKIAEGFVNCTDISHSEMFYWFRQRLVSPDNLINSLCASGHLPDGRYGFTLAGQYDADETDLPCTFLSVSQREQLQSLFDESEIARERAEAAHKKFLANAQALISAT